MARISRVLASVSVALLACAGPSTPSAPPAARGAAPVAKASGAAAASGAQRDSTVICEMERPTGSNIAQRVCRPATETEMQRLRTQDAMRTLPNTQTRKGQ